MTEKADRILLMTGINLNFLIGDRENRNTQAIRYRCFLSDLAGFTGLVVQPPAMTKKWMAERVGFEPTVGLEPTHNFQSCSFGLSDTSPEPDKDRRMAER